MTVKYTTYENGMKRTIVYADCDHLMNSEAGKNILTRRARSDMSDVLKEEERIKSNQLELFK